MYRGLVKELNKTDEIGVVDRVNWSDDIWQRKRPKIHDITDNGEIRFCVNDYCFTENYVYKVLSEERMLSVHESTICYTISSVGHLDYFIQRLLEERESYRELKDAILALKKVLK